MKGFIKSRQGLLALAVLFSALAVLSAAAVSSQVLSGALIGLFGAPAGVCWYRWRVCKQ